MNRVSQHILFATVCVVLITATTFGQYKLTKLSSNVAGAKHTDPQLVNGWGIAYAPKAPFWVSDEGTGVSTLYKASGLKSRAVHAFQRVLELKADHEQAAAELFALNPDAGGDAPPATGGSLLKKILRRT